jgi:hypothetical protein
MADIRYSGRMQVANWIPVVVSGCLSATAGLAGWQVCRSGVCREPCYRKGYCDVVFELEQSSTE